LLYKFKSSQIADLPSVSDANIITLKHSKALI